MTSYPNLLQTLATQSTIFEAVSDVFVLLYFLLPLGHPSHSSHQRLIASGKKWIAENRPRYFSNEYKSQKSKLEKRTKMVPRNEQ